VKPATKRGLLYGALILAAVASIAMNPSDVGEVSAPVARPRVFAERVKPDGQQKQPISTLGLERLERSLPATEAVNPFGVKSWVPVQAVVAPVAAPVAAPVQTVPPLPFAYAGKLEVDPGNWVVYLTRAGQSFAVAKGDQFDGSYRLDGFEHGKLVIMYLPLETKQYLPTGTDFSE
jgi:hypothetical protein